MQITYNIRYKKLSALKNDKECQKKECFQWGKN